MELESIHWEWKKTQVNNESNYGKIKAWRHRVNK